MEEQKIHDPIEMILELNNPLVVPKIMELAKVVPGTPIEYLEKMLLDAIGDKLSAIYYHDKEGAVKGFIFASEETWESERVAFIQFCVVMPDSYENFICFELITKIRLWAKDRGIKTMIFSTKRNYKPFVRKYKFELTGYILKRPVMG